MCSLKCEYNICCMNQQSGHEIYTRSAAFFFSSFPFFLYIYIKIKAIHEAECITRKQNVIKRVTSNKHMKTSQCFWTLPLFFSMRNKRRLVGAACHHEVHCVQSVPKSHHCSVALSFYVADNRLPDIHEGSRNLLCFQAL